MIFGYAHVYILNRRIEIIRTALLSVYKKEGIVEFARELQKLGWSILASSGTHKILAANGIFATDVASIVGEPILGHQVVTLSREIHAGLLAKDTPEDKKELERLGIKKIDLVCVDLYPLEDAIANGEPYEKVIELTDIGGPTLLRSAAKGGRIVIADPSRRKVVLDWLRAGEPNGDVFRMSLAALAERIVGDYCLTSGEYLNGRIRAETIKRTQIFLV
ncbi:MAG TPA: hypothetical protein VI432_02610 [Candidatus Paceibacterota bacterium]